MKPLLSANDAIAKWRCDPEFTAAYDALEEEFALVEQRIGLKAMASPTQPTTANKSGNQF
jgi:hypothetical protein